MLKRTISAIVIAAFLFTQCGLGTGYAYDNLSRSQHPQNLRKEAAAEAAGETVASIGSALGVPASATGEEIKVKIVSIVGEIYETTTFPVQFSRILKEVQSVFSTKTKERAVKGYLAELVKENKLQQTKKGSSLYLPANVSIVPAKKGAQAGATGLEEAQKAFAAADKALKAYDRERAGKVTERGSDHTREVLQDRVDSTRQTLIAAQKLAAAGAAGGVKGPAQLGRKGPSDTGSQQVMVAGKPVGYQEVVTKMGYTERQAAEAAAEAERAKKGGKARANGEQMTAEEATSEILRIVETGDIKHIDFYNTFSVLLGRIDIVDRTVDKNLLDNLVRTVAGFSDDGQAVRIVASAENILVMPIFAAEPTIVGATGEPMTQDEALKAIERFFNRRIRGRGCENILRFRTGISPEMPLVIRLTDTDDYQTREPEIIDIMRRIAGVAEGEDSGEDVKYFVLEGPNEVKDGILIREMAIWPASTASRVMTADEAASYLKPIIENEEFSFDFDIDGFVVGASNNSFPWIEKQIHRLASITPGNKLLVEVDTTKQIVVIRITPEKPIEEPVVTEHSMIADEAIDYLNGLTDKGEGFSAVCIHRPGATFSGLRMPNSEEWRTMQVLEGISGEVRTTAALSPTKRVIIKTREGGLYISDMYPEGVEVTVRAMAAGTGREIAAAVRDALKGQYTSAVAVLDEVRQVQENYNLDGIQEAVNSYKEGVDLSAKTAKTEADADKANQLAREVSDVLEDEFELAEAFYQGEFYRAETVDSAVDLIEKYAEGVQGRLEKAEEAVKNAAEAEKREALISGFDANSVSRVSVMLQRIGFLETNIAITYEELTPEALAEARQRYSIVITQANAIDPFNIFMSAVPGLPDTATASNIDELRHEVEKWISA